MGHISPIQNSKTKTLIFWIYTSYTYTVYMYCYCAKNNSDRVHIALLCNVKLTILNGRYLKSAIHHSTYHSTYSPCMEAWSCDHLRWIVAIFKTHCTVCKFMHGCMLSWVLLNSIACVIEHVCFSWLVFLGRSFSGFVCNLHVRHISPEMQVSFLGKASGCVVLIMWRNYGTKCRV